MSAGVALVILAAGKGTRMRSALPKVLHPVAGVPMVRWVLAAGSALGPAKTIVVVGHEGEQVREALSDGEITFVTQTELLGTADALKRCREAAGGCETIVVLNGDCPLVTSALLERLVASRGVAPVALASCEVDEPGRLGRIVRDSAGTLSAIVEAADYEGPAGQAEINAGQYVFEAEWLWENLVEIPVSAKGEYYLTHLASMAHEQGRPGITFSGDPADLLGVDDRVALAQAERAMRQRILREHMLNGVTIADPETTYVDGGVTIEPDVTILQNSWLSGATSVGSGSVIGPSTTLRESVIGPNCVVRQSAVEESELAEGVRAGPFAHVRGRSYIGPDCELGNYSEVNRSHIGRGVKMHHFSYLGDATVGDGANIAAGVITCNYDGVNKNPTVIGAGAFVGCDTMLVAPVTMGDGAQTGAGTVLNRDLGPGQRAVGVPARLLPERSEGHG